MVWPVGRLLLVHTPRFSTVVSYGGVERLIMVAYFCHHLSDNYFDLSDNYVDLSDLYVDLSDHYVDLSENYHHI